MPVVTCTDPACPVRTDAGPWRAPVMDGDDARMQLYRHRIYHHGADHAAEPSMIIEVDTPTDDPG